MGTPEGGLAAWPASHGAARSVTLGAGSPRVEFTGFPRILLLDYLQHRWRLLPTRLPPGFALLTRKGYAAFFMRASDPQLSVIARPHLHSSQTLSRSMAFQVAPVTDPADR